MDQKRRGHAKPSDEMDRRLAEAGQVQGFAPQEQESDIHGDAGRPCVSTRGEATVTRRAWDARVNSPWRGMASLNWLPCLLSMDVQRLNVRPQARRGPGINPWSRTLHPACPAGPSTNPNRNKRRRSYGNPGIASQYR